VRAEGQGADDQRRQEQGLRPSHGQVPPVAPKRGTESLWCDERAHQLGIATHDAQLARPRWPPGGLRGARLKAGAPTAAICRPPVFWARGRRRRATSSPSRERVRGYLHGARGADRSTQPARRFRNFTPPLIAASFGKRPPAPWHTGKPDWKPFAGWRGYKTS